MAWVNWPKKQSNNQAGRGTLGIDLNNSRMRAVEGTGNNAKLLPLDAAHPDLALTIALDGRQPRLGRAAIQCSRELPHVICSDYLAALGEQRTWKHGRHRLTPEAAMTLGFEQLQQAAVGYEAFAIATPAMMTLPQVLMMLKTAEKARCKIVGTASTPLVLAAERATHFIHGSNSRSGTTPRSFQSTSVLIIDADDYALNATLVRITPEEVRKLHEVNFPKLGVKLWREKLLNSLSDRCVRVCRRDPRDSAAAEQLLFDQIDPMLDHIRTEPKLMLAVRGDHWYQDLIISQNDLDQFCRSLWQVAVDEIRHFLSPLQEEEPPRAVWLTHDAGRLPGLAPALHQHMSERTSVRILHSEATAAAVLNLTLRWDKGELSRNHLNQVIPLPKRTTEGSAAPPSNKNSSPSTNPQTSNS